MGFENKYPYTDFHELNLDWILEQMKSLAAAWDAYQEELTGTNGEWPTFKNYIETSWATYQNNLTGPTGEWPTFKAAMELAWQQYQDSLTGVGGEWPTFKATMEGEWQQFFDTYLQTLGVVQTTGQSITDVMSQKAVTDSLIDETNKLIDFAKYDARWSYDVLLSNDHIFDTASGAYLSLAGWSCFKKKGVILPTYYGGMTPFGIVLWKNGVYVYGTETLPFDYSPYDFDEYGITFRLQTSVDPIHCVFENTRFDTELSTINTTLTANSNKLVVVNGNLAYDYSLVQDGPTAQDISDRHGYISDGNGAFNAAPASYFYTTDYIDVSNVSVVKMFISRLDQAMNPLYFYDENKNFVGKYVRSDFGTTVYDVSYRIIIPAGVKYVRSTMWIDSVSRFFKLYISTNYMEIDTEIEKLKNPNIAGDINYVSFGDSITEGFGVSLLGSYSQRLENELTFKSFTNEGVSGASVIKQNNTYNILYEKTSLYTNFEGIMTVMIGTNDYGNLNSPLGDVDAVIAQNFSDLTPPSTTYDPAYTFAEGFRYTMEKLKTDNPKALIICLLPVNRSVNGANTLGYTLEQYREAERKICTALGIQYIEMQQSGVPVYNSSTYYILNGGVPDGLHPNDYGHYLMTEYLIPVMKNAISEITYLIKVLS